MPLSITTWNINSVRLRMPLVAKFLTEHAPDVLCLQETKVRDAEFPLGDFHRLGYAHVAINGQKGYHGVAIASRIPFAAIDKRGFCEKGDARHLAVTLSLPGGARDGLTIHNFYIPAGGDEPDADINPKFAHKLAFLDEMAAWMNEGALTQGQSVLVGDLNVAPLDTDVWNHKALLKIVSHTPVETARLTGILETGRWVDAMRRIVPPEEKLYTWWSYRSPNWELADKGRRLDHVWVSSALAGAVDGMHILREARGWVRPSDHVPVTIRLAS